MGGISSSTGIFSGIDTKSLIDQLLAVEARPKQVIQTRGIQLQQQRAVFLDLNTRMNALKAAAAAFRTGETFKSMSATSSDADTLVATASKTATEGSYAFLVDRLVSSQQALTRGFANKDLNAIGMSYFSVESDRANLEHDVALSDLNDGEGVARGKLTIRDSTGVTATIDLSKAASVDDVLSAINDNGTAAVTASVRDGRLVIKDNAGGQVLVQNAVGSTTATSLGIAGTATGELVGAEVYRMSGATTLASLNDGNGVAIKRVIGENVSQFSILVDRENGPETVVVNLGDVYETVGGTLTKTEGAVSTIEGVLTRINDALADAGLDDVNASVATDGKRLQIVDSDSGAPGTITVTDTDGGTTARDLGLVGSAATTLSGARVMSGMGTTLARSLNGGQGVAGDGAVNFTLRNGATFAASVNKDASLTEIARAIETASVSAGSARVKVEVNSKGTGLEVTDLTGGSTSNLIITGTGGSDTAASLGISTGASGVASATVSGSNLQRQYLSKATDLSTIVNGKALGTGEIKITDSYGNSANVTFTDDDKTLGDVINKINSRGLKILARVNAHGDGLELIEDTGGQPAGATKIKIQDVTGTVAKGLNLVGEASGTGASNKIDGTFERTVAVASTDTLSQIASKVNLANVGVSATIIRDGSGSTPFRLSLASQGSGSAGRFLIDTGSFDLGTSVIDRGHDARVFFGGTDPATAVLLSSSSNTLDDVVSGVRIDLKGVSEDPVTVTVNQDTGAIESAVDSFVAAYNDLVSRIDALSKYDPTSERAGVLLGDSTALNMRSELFRTIQGTATGNSGSFTRLTQVGINVAKGGVLEVDKTRLHEALAEDAASVEALFAGRTLKAKDSDPNNDTTEKEQFTLLGVVGQVEELAKRYTDTVDGIITVRGRSLDAQVSNINKRVVDMDKRLEIKRSALQTQFLAMEQAIAKMQTQGSYLSQSLG